MRVLVCGSRDFNDYNKLKEVLDACSIDEIIHGAAGGADALAGRYGDEASIPMQIYPADWNTYGRSAGPIRNGRMLKEGNPEMVIAFWDGKSRGTMNMIQQAEIAGIEVKVIDI